MFYYTIIFFCNYENKAEPAGNNGKKTTVMNMTSKE